MTILVTGATGNVGKHVVSALSAAGEPVRAVSRTPSRIPDGIPTAKGGIADTPDLLDGVDRVFLVWPFTNADEAPPIVTALAAQTSQVVFLSARGASDDSPLFHGRIERLLRDSGVDWTFLRAGGFATNTLEWADRVRTGTVRWVHGEAGRALIHERDIADVAAAALTSPAHTGAAYDLTGPETLTQVEQVRTLGAATGREVRWEEMPVEEARATLFARGWDPAFVDTGLAYWASLVTNPENDDHDGGGDHREARPHLRPVGHRPRGGLPLRRPPAPDFQRRPEHRQSRPQTGPLWTTGSGNALKGALGAWPVS